MTTLRFSKCVKVQEEERSVCGMGGMGNAALCWVQKISKAASFEVSALPAIQKLYQQGCAYLESPNHVQ